MNKFQSMAIDIFEGKNSGYLVNELQTIFGHIPDKKYGTFHRLEVNGIPGRYINKDGKWIFEEGDFNTNQSYDLRLETAIDLYEKSKL